MAEARETFADVPFRQGQKFGLDDGVAIEGNLGSRHQADSYIARTEETESPVEGRGKARTDNAITDPRRPRSNAIETVIAHGNLQAGFRFASSGRSIDQR